LLNQHEYVYDALDQRTRQTRKNGDYVDYGYDALGQLVDARAKESGGTSRSHEQFGYAYDAAGNLNYRTNNALVQTFTVNTLNQLSNATRSGNMTVAGVTHGAATSVTVATNTGAGLAADRYADNAFARADLPLTNGNNTFTAVATDSSGRGDTNAITAYLPSTASFQYDLNGNLIFDGLRGMAYDDENQLIRVTVTNSWKSEFTYDGKMRRRIRREYEWRNSAWALAEEVRYVYDGNLVIQERDRFNVAKVTYTRGKDLSGGLEGAGGIGGLLARTDHGLLAIGDSQPSAYYAADGNGNVTCLVDTNQNVVGRYLYDPFGNTLAATGPIAEANLYRFSSKELHAASGLVYYLYRFYDVAAHEN
jgi:YD repeat-containing protein